MARSSKAPSIGRIQMRNTNFPIITFGLRYTGSRMMNEVC